MSRLWLVFAAAALVTRAGRSDASTDVAATAWRFGLSWARSLSGSTFVRDIQNIVETESASGIARFYLTTKSDEGITSTMQLSKENIEESPFDPTLETKVLIHGYLCNWRVRWVQKLTDELLDSGYYNVIAVDWGGRSGAATLYPLAVSRTRVVANETASLVSALRSIAGASPAMFHLIGHSLGAHVAGFVGSQTPGLGRITGLDPAGPGFEYVTTADRLDPSDAVFVDAIHTDAPSVMEILRGNAGFGTSQAMGHADFYPNGGRSQPACPRTLAESNVWDVVTCDHDIATDYFIASIRHCSFAASPCSSYWSFSSGSCRWSAADGAVNSMGFRAVKPSSGSATYYPNTGTAWPYCSSAGGS